MENTFNQFQGEYFFLKEIPKIIENNETNSK